MARIEIIFLLARIRDYYLLLKDILANITQRDLLNEDFFFF